MVHRLIASVRRRLSLIGDRPCRPVPALTVDTVASYQEFERLSDEKQDDRAVRRAAERGLVQNNSAFRVAGCCYVCGYRRKFEVNFAHAYKDDTGTLTPNWRESLVCPGCGLNNRMRATMQLVEQRFGLLPTHIVYITEQQTPLFDRLKAKCTSLVGSEFLGDDVAPGSTSAAGLRHEDLTRLTFSANSFDFILSFEVFEHIPDYRAAFSECLRCLRPGGRLLFTVPFLSTSRENLVRARIQADGTIEHLLPPEYHGDPIRSEGCLAFYQYGWELLDHLRVLGFVDVTALRYWSLEHGYLGEGGQFFFSAQKEVR